MKPFFHLGLSFLFLLCFSIYSNGQIISSIAGNGNYGYGGDGGPATGATLWDADGVAVDDLGNVYLADTYNNRIRCINTSGVIYTVAGNGHSGFTGNNGPATAAELNNPSALAVDRRGMIYFTEAGTNCIRRVNAAGIISVFAGNGANGFSGDGGPATRAALSNPLGISVDTNNNVYFADEYNHRIREVNTNGIIKTVAGCGIAGFGGDGGAALSAELNYPAATTVDREDNLYIVDYLNNRIRKVDKSGIITTVAGNGTTGYSGDGGAATEAAFYEPVAVALDISGNLYVADMHNNCVRKVTTDGQISTYAGNTTPGFDGNDGPATAAQLYYPVGVATDVVGNLYISDYFNYRIRKITANNSGLRIIAPPVLNLYPNPCTGNFTFEIPGETASGTIMICDVTGKILITRVLDRYSSSRQLFNLEKWGSGMYFVKYVLGILSLEKTVIKR